MIDWVKYEFQPGSRCLATRCNLVTFCKVGSGACTQCAHFIRREDTDQIVLCGQAHRARTTIKPGLIYVKQMGSDGSAYFHQVMSNGISLCNLKRDWIPLTSSRLLPCAQCTHRYMILDGWRLIER